MRSKLRPQYLYIIYPPIRRTEGRFDRASLHHIVTLHSLFNTLALNEHLNTLAPRGHYQKYFRDLSSCTICTDLRCPPQGPPYGTTCNDPAITELIV